MQLWLYILTDHRIVQLLVSPWSLRCDRRNLKNSTTFLKQYLGKATPIFLITRPHVIMVPHDFILKIIHHVSETMVNVQFAPETKKWKL